MIKFFYLSMGRWREEGRKKKKTNVGWLRSENNTGSLGAVLGLGRKSEHNQVGLFACAVGELKKNEKSIMSSYKIYYII